MPELQEENDGKQAENDDEAKLFHAFVGRHAPRHLAYRFDDGNGSLRLIKTARYDRYQPDI